MEVIRIEQTNQTVNNEKIRLQKFGAKACIYYPEVSCSAPRLKYKICRACPRCGLYVRQNVVKSLYNHIKSLAISLMRRMDVQLSK
ncbi:MAG: hypothetical protein KKA31_00010 [Candidatus Margulisbacteria bacterium]|nr:hypothetical protein [Candidatus Margulisiibacteriota bacterium]